MMYKSHSHVKILQFMGSVKQQVFILPTSNYLKLHLNSNSTTFHCNSLALPLMFLISSASLLVQQNRKTGRLTVKYDGFSEEQC